MLGGFVCKPIFMSKPTQLSQVGIEAVVVTIIII